jgi:hypothetical protein
MRDYLRIQLFVFSSFLGGWAGAVLSLVTLGQSALKQARAEHPGEYICGLFAFPYLVLGFVPGAVIGAVAAWQGQRWLAKRWRPPPPN